MLTPSGPLPFTFSVTAALLTKFVPDLLSRRTFWAGDKKIAKDKLGKAGFYAVRAWLVRFHWEQRQAADRQVLRDQILSPILIVLTLPRPRPPFFSFHSFLSVCQGVPLRRPQKAARGDFAVIINLVFR